MRRQIVFLLVAIFVCCATHPSFAEDREDFNLLAPPEIPAFSVLGASPETISRPGTVQDLAADVVYGIGNEGKIRQGLAIEVSLAEFLKPINLDNYQSKRRHFILQNLRFSLATIRTAGDSAATDAAFGIRIPIFNDADPMRDGDHVKALAKILVTGAPGLPGQDNEEREAAVRAEKRKLDAKFQKANWNASRMEVALALSARAETSRAKDFGVRGVSGWLATAVRLSHWGQLLTLGRYDWLNDRPNETGAHSISYGGRFVVGSHRFNAYSELVGKSSFYSNDGAPNQCSCNEDTSGSWAFGVEQRLPNGLWLTTGVGSRFEEALEEADHVLLLAGLRWGVSSEARMGAN